MPNARRGSDSCSDPRDGEHTQANAYPRQNIGGNQSTSQHAHNYNEVSAPEPGCDPQQRASTGEAVALTRLCRPAPPETAAPTPSNVRPTLLFRATAPAAARQSNRVEAMVGCWPRTCYQHRHEQTTGHRRVDRMAREPYCGVVIITVMRIYYFIYIVYSIYIFIIYIIFYIY